MNDTDGKVIIGTVVDNREFFKAIKEIENTKPREFEIDPKLNIKQLQDEILKAYAEIQKYKGQEILSIEDVTKLQEYISFIEKANARIEELGGRQVTIVGLTDAKEDLEDMADSAKKLDLSHIEKQLNSIGKSTQKVTKNVVKWGLAVFSIRSAYLFIRSSVSTLAQYDKQLAVNIQYIRYLLANTLKPVIDAIVQAAYKLLTYIKYIASKWFGFNKLFAGASEEFAKNLSAGEDSAKSIKNNLQQAPFDEMNILSDNSGGGGGESVTLPDFKDFGDVAIPDWVKWIGENKDLVLAALGGITTALIAMKLLGLDPIVGLGIGILVTGIILAIESLIAYLNDPSWENFGGIVQGIGVALLGLALIIGSIPVAVAGAIVLILGTIMKYWEDIKAFLQKGIDWLTGKSDFIHEHFGDVIGGIYDYIVATLQRVLDWFDLTFTSIKKIFDGIIKFVKGAFTGDWKQAWEGIKQIFGGIWDWIKGTAKLVLEGLIGKAKEITTSVGDVISGVFKAAVNGVLSAIEGILNFPINAINKLINTINKVPGIDLDPLNTFDLPKLEKGGIINRPGAGVPIGGAIGGERGAEWVQPLTDEQSLDLVADRIGKRIVIDLTNVVDINGRQLQRDFKRINGESDFAYNR